ncbi:hypothetical protein ACQP2F_15215 [Actinoplanes sp. CA-030573]|uniref:hypothetical protein n=1 Tax=Actinoplanes sp. CA-030573 TaxID=3239898 RepID=UPI003D8C3E89
MLQNLTQAVDRVVRPSRQRDSPATHRDPCPGHHRCRHHRDQQSVEPRRQDGAPLPACGNLRRVTRRGPAPGEATRRTRWLPRETLGTGLHQRRHADQGTTRARLYRQRAHRAPPVADLARRHHQSGRGDRCCSQAPRGDRVDHPAGRRTHRTGTSRPGPRSAAL